MHTLTNTFTPHTLSTSHSQCPGVKRPGCIRLCAASARRIRSLLPASDRGLSMWGLPHPSMGEPPTDCPKPGPRALWVARFGLPGFRTFPFWVGLSPFERTRNLGPRHTALCAVGPWVSSGTLVLQLYTRSRTAFSVGALDGRGIPPSPARDRVSNSLPAACCLQRLSQWQQHPVEELSLLCQYQQCNPML